MAYVIKTNPCHFDSAELGSNVEITERTFYGGHNICADDEAFVWLSETSGGSGLVWQARVASIDRGRPLTVSLCLTKRLTAGPLGVEDLVPFRDSNDETPISELARKLYRHSHNKIAAIGPEASDFLRQRFE